MKQLSFHQSQKQHKHIGTTIIDIVRQINDKLEQTHDFPLDNVWNERKGKKLSELTSMKYSKFTKNNSNTMIPLYSDLATTHHKDFMERFTQYQKVLFHTAPPEGEGLDLTLEDFAQNKTFGTYEYSTVKAIRAGSRTVTTITNPVRNLGRKKTAGKKDSSGNALTHGLDSVHFLFLRFFEYPYTQVRLKNNFMKSTRSLIDKGCLDFETVLTLVAHALALCPKSWRGSVDVLKTFKDDPTVEFRKFTNKCILQMKRQFSMDFMNDMLNAFDLYSGLNTKNLGKLWMNICRPFYDRLKNKTGQAFEEELNKIQFDDGIDTINMFFRMAIDNTGKEKNKLTSQELWVKPGKEASVAHSFFNFMSVFWTYHLALCNEPKILSKAPVSSFLRGRYCGGSLVPRFINLTYRDIPRSEVQTNGNFPGPNKLNSNAGADLYDFSRTFQADADATVDNVIYKKLPFSPKGLIELLSTINLNTEEKEFNVLNMNTYLINWISPERTHGDDDGKKLALTPEHQNERLFYYDCTRGVRTYEQFEVRYTEKVVKPGSTPDKRSKRASTTSDEGNRPTPVVDANTLIDTGLSPDVTNGQNSDDTNAASPATGNPNTNETHSTTNHVAGREGDTDDLNEAFSTDSTKHNETILSLLFPKGYSLECLPLRSDRNFLDKFLALCGLSDKGIDVPNGLKDDDVKMKTAIYNRQCALGLLQEVISENNDLKTLLEVGIREKYSSRFGNGSDGSNESDESDSSSDDQGSSDEEESTDEDGNQGGGEKSNDDEDESSDKNEGGKQGDEEKSNDGSIDSTEKENKQPRRVDKRKEVPDEAADDNQTTPPTKRRSSPRGKKNNN